MFDLNCVIFQLTLSKWISSQFDNLVLYFTNYLLSMSIKGRERADDWPNFSLIIGGIAVNK